MVKEKLDIWDVIAWIVLALILIWVILKTLGIINTPLWLQYAPVYGAVYLAGWNIHKLDVVTRDVKELKKFKHVTIEKITRLEHKLNFVNY